MSSSNIGGNIGSNIGNDASGIDWKRVASPDLLEQMDDSIKVQIAKVNEQSQRRCDKIMKRAAEQEAQRKVEEEKRKAEEEAKQKAEEEKRKTKEEEKQKAEENKCRAEEEYRAQAEVKRKQKADAREDKEGSCGSHEYRGDRRGNGELFGGGAIDPAGPSHAGLRLPTW